MTPVARERVFHALAEVHDPELDEPITSLGFVASCEVGPDGDVDVALRLPTPQCAPNFAFLMAADARRVVRRLPGVREVTVQMLRQIGYGVVEADSGQAALDALARGENYDLMLVDIAMPGLTGRPDGPAAPRYTF